jgi:hypothetical protein
MHAMSSNRLPKDVVDLTHGHNIAEFVQEFQSKIMQSVTEEEEEDADR